ncbi:MAG: hypothetical protein JWN94_1025 [Betaproteobacteria bacterium]|nr:hypothetical protein [Betaproteobacteria bacterium]
MNQYKMCNAKGCMLSRHRVSGYCRVHERGRRLYGHALGYHFKSKEFNEERQLVTEFIGSNIEHKGIASALAFLRQWLERSTSGDKLLPAYEDFHRLNSKCIKPIDILIEAATVWLYSERHRERLPDDLRLTYAISLAVLHLAPRDYRSTWSQGRETVSPQRLSAAARLAVGEHIRTNLGLLISNIVRTMQKQQSEQHEFRQSLSAPFSTTK